MIYPFKRCQNMKTRFNKMHYSLIINDIDKCTVFSGNVLQTLSSTKWQIMIVSIDQKTKSHKKKLLEKNPLIGSRTILFLSRYIKLMVPILFWFLPLWNVNYTGTPEYCHPMSFRANWNKQIQVQKVNK